MRIWILAIAAVAVLIGAVGGAYWYGGNGANESALVLNRAPAASDGIKVHGDWTLTVSNPDGSVDSVHEFENAFNTGTGPAVLMWALKGEGAVKDNAGANKWKVTLSNSSSQKLCESDQDDTYQLYTSVVHNGPYFHDTEAFQVDMTCRIEDEIQGGSDIQKVVLAAYLNNALAPSYGGSIGTGGPVDFALTMKNLSSSPIPVVPGQLVSTTVRVTFE